MTQAWPPGRSEEELLERVYGRARTLRARRRFGAAGVVSALAAATLIPVLALPATHPSQAINTANQAPNGAAGTRGSGGHSRSGATTTIGGSGAANIGPGGSYPGSSVLPGGVGGGGAGRGSPGTRGDHGPGPTTEPAGSGAAGGTQPGVTTTTLPGPKANSVSPPYGPMSGGTTVTITGTDLSQVTEVLFGTRPAHSFQVKSPTTIIAVTPASSSPGMVPIGVYNRSHQGNADGSCWTNPLCTDGYLYVPDSPATGFTLVVPSGGPRGGLPGVGDVRRQVRLPHLP